MSKSLKLIRLKIISKVIRLVEPDEANV
jgi:hypothetical protein